MSDGDTATQAIDGVGLNEMTVMAILGIILVGVIGRYLTMAFSPSLLKKLIRSENLQTKTVKNSIKP